MIEKFKDNPIYFLTLLGLLLIAGWFYWYQWRPSKIKKICYKQAYQRANENNMQWAEGKNWDYVPSGLQPYLEDYKEPEGRNRLWGWIYPDQSRGESYYLAQQELRYKNCLREGGL